MNMQETSPARYRSAVTAFAVGLSVLVFYILACVSSPVAWSPDSAKIALLVKFKNDPGLIRIFMMDLVRIKHEINSLAGCQIVQKIPRLLTW